MARDATARLYGVQESSLVFKRRFDQEEYDIGEIHFQAKKGNLVDLHKLRESIWATRLSSGTKSGAISLKVTVVGTVVMAVGQAILQPTGSTRQFVLAPDPAAKKGEKTVFDGLGEAARKGSDKVFRVTAKVEGWTGRWPTLLKKKFPESPRIFVTGFEIDEE